MVCKYLKSKREEFQCSEGSKTTESFICSLFETIDDSSSVLNIGCKMADSFKRLTGNSVVLNEKNAPCYFHAISEEKKCPYFKDENK